MESDDVNGVNVNDLIKKVSELPANLRFVNNDYLVSYIKDRFKKTKNTIVFL